MKICFASSVIHEIPDEYFGPVKTLAVQYHPFPARVYTCKIVLLLSWDMRYLMNTLGVWRIWRFNILHSLQGFMHRKFMLLLLWYMRSLTNTLGLWRLRQFIILHFLQGWWTYNLCFFCVWDFWWILWDNKDSEKSFSSILFIGWRIYNLCFFYETCEWNNCSFFDGWETCPIPWLKYGCNDSILCDTTTT